MKLIRQITDLNKAIEKNQKLGFIPTMGGLHNGHESLIKISKKKCDITIVSIFINPTQFNTKNDYKTYPRNLNKDLKILKKLKVNFVFLPKVNQIYNNKKSIKFKLKSSQKIMCAKYRKGHFEGVLDVMNRLVGLILPKYVFMGEKDFQQLFLVKNFIEDKYKTKIYSCRTVRDNNKVALSSRNYLLNEANLKTAGDIAKKIIKLKSQINKNKKRASGLIKEIRKELTIKFNIKIEYFEARNINNLKKEITHKKYRLFIAYYLNKVRLIDNF